jgi:hypothetical protein
MLPEERRAIFMGSGMQQIRRSGTGKEGRHGKRRRRSPVGPHSDSRREYRRWANVMLQDHELLRQLLDRFECALDSRERASLFHLAMEFHEAHQRFEHAWDPTPELDPERLDLEQMTGLIEHLRPEGPAWNAMARAWGARLRALMEKEDQLYCGKRKQERPFAAGLPGDLLECRLSLISEVREALQS